MGMPKRTNLRGINTDGVLRHRRFEKLVATGESKTLDSGKVVWELICNCGNVIWLSRPELRKWMDRYPYIPFNCGCYTEIYLKRAIQQASESENHRLRFIYNEMMDKCNPKSKRYENTKVCPEWADKKTGYATFVEWAYRDGYYMEQPEETPEEELWKFWKSPKVDEYNPISCEFKEPVIKKEKIIEHHLVFTGIEYTFEQFCNMLEVPPEDFNNHLHNHTLNLMVHNIFHPENLYTIDDEGNVRDKDGNKRLLKKYAIEILD